MRVRSEEHTSELQSRQYLVCRLLLEKKKKSRQSLKCGCQKHTRLRAASTSAILAPRVNPRATWASAWSRTRRAGPPIFFFNDTATTEIYTLSLHDALPISSLTKLRRQARILGGGGKSSPCPHPRSEEHTSELQSRQYLVCRLLLEKKK